MGQSDHPTRETVSVVSTPIPLLCEMPDVAGRRMIAIRDSRDRLVRLNDLMPDRVIVRPEYFSRGYRAASPYAFAREAVAEMLVEAAKLLPSSLKLLIWDAWRPTALQEELFAQEYQRRRALNPDLSEADVFRETQKYVSVPAKDPATPAPHLTGGAVDLTICGVDGVPVEMGTSFDDFSEKAATRYFEEQAARGHLNPADQQALEHRRLLYTIMTTIGFTAYRDEWWHFDYGDQFWAATLGRESIYAGHEPPIN